MYIKVRSMTGGDPATITVSKLTTIKELRVRIKYHCPPLTLANEKDWHPNIIMLVMQLVSTKMAKVSLRTITSRRW